MIVTTFWGANPIATGVLKTGIVGVVIESACVVNISGRAGARVSVTKGIATIGKFGLARTDNGDGTVTVEPLSSESGPNNQNRVTLY